VQLPRPEGTKVIIGTCEIESPRGVTLLLHERERFGLCPEPELQPAGFSVWGCPQRGCPGGHPCDGFHGLADYRHRGSECPDDIKRYHKIPFASCPLRRPFQAFVVLLVIKGNGLVKKDISQYPRISYGYLLIYFDIRVEWISIAILCYQ